MFGPITDVERTVWQRQALAVLADVLVEAAKAELPCVHWELGTGRTLMARCLQRGDGARRAAFVAWADFLGIADRREWDSVGLTHLQAGRSDFRGCNVVVLADLYQDADEAGDRS